jgi:hypothetical protein
MVVRQTNTLVSGVYAAVQSGLADRVIAALDKLVADLNRSDRLDLSLAYARGVPWISEILLGAETAEQVTHRALGIL